MMTRRVWYGLLVLLLLAQSVWLWLPVVAGAEGAGPPSTQWLLKKGYSHELVTVTDTQRYRQEWRLPPAPLRTPKQQIWRNVVINDPLGNVDPFGSYLIRERQ
ncbi:MAG: hypothetical protein U0003_01115 [Vampirovibrionales bacterium]